MGKEGNAIEEQNALMANGGQKPPQKENFKTFLYRKNDAGESVCLGRTSKSWLQITVFYIIFYAFLAGFWLSCLYLFLLTLDTKVPRFYGAGNIIGDTPGLGFQPWLSSNPESTLIKFKLNDPESYQPYVDALNTYFEKYKNTTGTRDCSKAGVTNQDLFKESNSSEYNEQACRFDVSVFDKGGCGPKDNYGYNNRGKPCVVLSLNRLIGWQPVGYPNAASVPDVIKDRYQNGSIAIHCDGTNEADKETIGRIEYYPKHGIDGRFYPYGVVTNYHQPVAMVKFTGLTRNRLVLVECRAYAANIKQDAQQKIGAVQFEILMYSDNAKISKKEDL